MNKYVLAIGELLADVISTEYCESLEDATGFHFVQGGSPANVAATIMHLGGDARLVSCVGNDGIGRYLISAVKKSGLNPSHIQIHRTEPSSLVMVTKSRGTPDFIPYRHADAYIASIDNLLLQNATVIHTTSFALSKEPARSTILKAIEKGFDQKKTVSIDWNFAPKMWGADDGKTIFERVMNLRPLLKLSMDDMERFWQKSLTIEECKGLLNVYDASVICITCGKNGIWYKAGSSAWLHEPAPPVENVIDVTGAGDAFWAGFLTAFLLNEKMTSCTKNGAATAAKKIQKSGPLYL